MQVPQREPDAPLAALGLGLAAIGRPAYITTGREHDLGDDRSIEVFRARAHALLDAAWARGIRFFDAARSYGRAEEFLGSWLAAHPERRDDLVVESKWGYEYVGAWRMDAPVHERKEHSLAMLDRQWPETLSALGGPPDAYLVHSVTPESPALSDAVLLDRLRELAATGVRIGISTSGPAQGDVLDAARALADTPFSAVQATWNLLEPSAGPALARAHAAGWLVVVKEALANGRLSPEGVGDVDAADGREAPDASAARVAVLAAVENQSADVFALGVARAQPWCDVVLSGAVTEEQLASNLASGDASNAVETSALGALDALAEPPAQYWAERSARGWH
ncbi:aldo/keto reductase [Agromyces protaetiae]|uniref:Aldo/keto reductase n=1 Tax=Agromyces protaetiae TaxID=2509455 RepID=A0A4P6F8Z3_9MICO|nr:aldo/keto reductase [Agromyces protaetiae]QAY72234.1 aldo/keto reductase [Agromyces protaetiae]